MDPIFYVAAAVIVSLLLWFAIRSKTGEKPDAGNDTRDQPQPRQAGRVPVRRRNVLSRIQQRAQENQLNDQDSDDEDADSKKIGAKKRKKLEEKEERRKMREIEMREREERKREQEERDETRRLDDERKLKEEAKIAEEKRVELEEKERREHEEYLKLKAMFSVEEEGDEAINTEDGGENMLLQFVEFVKSKKVVLLEDLASHFGLRTQEAIDRVQTMLNDEILTGVVDDRGKFIYISNDELNAVAKFVKQRGRVSISDLAQASNSLVNLISESAT